MWVQNNLDLYEVKDTQLVVAPKGAQKIQAPEGQFVTTATSVAKS